MEDLQLEASDLGSGHMDNLAVRPRGSCGASLSLGVPGGKFQRALPLMAFWDSHCTGRKPRGGLGRASRTPVPSSPAQEGERGVLRSGQNSPSRGACRQCVLGADRALTRGLWPGCEFGGAGESEAADREPRGLVFTHTLISFFICTFLESDKAVRAAPPSFLGASHFPQGGIP